MKPFEALPSGTRPWMPGSLRAPGPQLARGVAVSGGSALCCFGAISGVCPSPWPSAPRSFSGPGICASPRVTRNARAMSASDPASARLRPLSPTGRMLLGRRVAVMQHERVALGVFEERHVAHAGVHRVGAELDAARLELAARRLDVVHVEGDRVVVRARLDAELLRVDEGDREAAGLELGAHRVLLAPQLRALEAEHVLVPLARSGQVPRGYADEVDAGDEAGHCGVLLTVGGW